MVANLLVYFADIGAFKPSSKIRYSPPATCAVGTGADVQAMLSSLSVADIHVEHSPCTAAGGPLSSTLIDTSDHIVADTDAADSVVTQLFTQMQPDGLCALSHLI